MFNVRKLSQGVFCFVFGSFIFLSCSETPVPKEEVAPTKEEIAFKEVMLVHDEIMPKTEEIRSLQALIIDTLSPEGNAVYRELEQADDAMMQWMHDFPMDNTLSEEQKLEYLEGQKIKIEIVKTMMLNSIELAKGYLENEKK